MNRLHIREALEAGFTIDYSAAGRPWAYKGSSGDRKEARECYTEDETHLMIENFYLSRRLTEAHARIEALKNEAEHHKNWAQTQFDRAQDLEREVQRLGSLLDTSDPGVAMRLSESAR